MAATSRKVIASLQLGWALSVFIVVISVETASTEPFEEAPGSESSGLVRHLVEDVSKRRLRFHRRSSPSEDALLNDSPYGREIPSALHGYYKRDAQESVYDRETRAPRLRFLKRDIPEAAYERDTREPRLRFLKRDLEASLFGRETRAPRLRFVKRSAPAGNLPLQEESAQAPLVSEAHSRKRRSLSPLGVAKRRLSFNNDYRAIADMIHNEEARRRREREEELRQRLLQIGKRVSDEVEELPVDSDGEGKGHVVRALADTLVDYALTP